MELEITCYMNVGNLDLYLTCISICDTVYCGTLMPIEHEMTECMFSGSDVIIIFLKVCHLSQ